MTFLPQHRAARVLIASAALLTVLSATVAHAGTWSSPPDYTVSGRQMTSGTDTNTTIPSGAAGGRSTTNPNVTLAQGGTDAQGNPQSQIAKGSVGTTFIWTPDADKTATTDPPPATVYVLEHGSATWTARKKLGGGGILQRRTRQRPGSSTHSALYSPRNGRAHVWYVQVAPEDDTDTA